MTRRFGGTERLAAITKEHFDAAKAKQPSSMFCAQILKGIVELSMTANKISRAEPEKQGQEDRPDLRRMSDEALRQSIVDMSREALLHDPRMLVALAVDQPEVVQAEFRKYGWKLVPPGDDGRWSEPAVGVALTFLRVRSTCPFDDFSASCLLR